MAAYLFAGMRVDRHFNFHYTDRVSILLMFENLDLSVFYDELRFQLHDGD